MALLTLICDAYISWAQSAEAGEFFEKEYEFYVMCLKLFIGKCRGYCIKFFFSNYKPKTYKKILFFSSKHISATCLNTMH